MLEPATCTAKVPEGYPEVLITTREWDVADQALEILAERASNLYQRGGQLVCVVRAEPEMDDEYWPCTDCHESHRILPHTNPAASIAPRNVARTCMKCHSRIEDVHEKAKKLQA